MSEGGPGRTRLLETHRARSSGPGSMCPSMALRSQKDTASRKVVVLKSRARKSMERPWFGAQGTEPLIRLPAAKTSQLLTSFL
jgi:hypothetical protein